MSGNNKRNLKLFKNVFIPSTYIYGAFPDYVLPETKIKLCMMNRSFNTLDMNEISKNHNYMQENGKRSGTILRLICPCSVDALKDPVLSVLHPPPQRKDHEPAEGVKDAHESGDGGHGHRGRMNVRLYQDCKMSDVFALFIREKERIRKSYFFRVWSQGKVSKIIRCRFFFKWRDHREQQVSRNLLNGWADFK
jgi:hypothetical protein